MKSFRIKFLLIAALVIAGGLPSIAQNSDQIYQKGHVRTEKQGQIQAYPQLESNIFKHTREVSITRETKMLTRGTQPFLHNVLQFLKTAGKSLLSGGILTILTIYVLLMLIIQVYGSYAKKNEWNFIL